MYPKKGEKFTISEDKKTKIRSHTDVVLTCIGVNDLSVIGSYPKECSNLLRKNIVFLKADRNFALMSPEQEEIQPEPKFMPVKNQAVLVKSINCHEWLKRYASGETNPHGHPLMYSYGCNSYTSRDEVTSSWTECEPDTMAPSALNWIEHDGKRQCPVDPDSKVMVGKEKFSNSIYVTSFAKDVMWADVKRYLLLMY